MSLHGKPLSQDTRSDRLAQSVCRLCLLCTAACCQHRAKVEG
ncbi:hypothetical protein I549_5225 [Mycobacterium avium subsp. avium 2285 (R)]|nr:hypothetical protein I549_5225 [Mycobacterium avium subsp. avium 2285 (R)]